MEDYPNLYGSTKNNSLKMQSCTEVPGSGRNSNASSKAHHKEEGVDLFSITPEARTRTSGWKPYREKSKLEIKRSVLTFRAIKH